MIDCSGCFAWCCKNVKGIIDAVILSDVPEKVKEEYMAFPHPIDASGKCSMLDESNKCKDYYNRPRMCNVDSFHLKYIKGESHEDFTLRIKKNCDTFKKANE